MGTHKSVWVKFSVVGFHNWPDAPADYDYLAARHRHTFNFEVHVPVNDSNREIEFHELKHTCKVLLGADIHDLEFGAQSCEMIAEGLAEQLLNRYTLPTCTVQVDEDGEAGATVVLFDDNWDNDEEWPSNSCPVPL